MGWGAIFFSAGTNQKMFLSIRNFQESALVHQSDVACMKPFFGGNSSKK